MEDSKMYILETQGSNLIDVLSQDHVDQSQTTTNDIIEIYEVFGIEAVREKIYLELHEVFKDKSPNSRHIELIADVMTYRGKIMQINRHGINKNTETGPIAKACFEEVMNIFVKAAVFAEVDKMKGVSSNILAGQFCNCGTNNFQILIDEEKVHLYGVEDTSDTENIESLQTDALDDKIEEMFNENDADDIDNSDFNFGFGIENTQQYSLGKNIDFDKTNIKIMNKNMGDVVETIIQQSDEKSNDEIIVNNSDKDVDTEIDVDNNNNIDNDLKNELDNLNIENNDNLNIENNDNKLKVKVKKAVKSKKVAKTKKAVKANKDVKAKKKSD